MSGMRRAEATLTKGAMGKGSNEKAACVSRLVLRRSYLSGGQGVRAWSSGKTERLRSVVALPEG